MNDGDQPLCARECRNAQCHHRLKVCCRACVRGCKNARASVRPSTGVEPSLPASFVFLHPSFYPPRSNAALSHCVAGEAVRARHPLAAAPAPASKKIHAGRPSGVLKCVVCSKKKRPCGAACASWPGHGVELLTALLLPRLSLGRRRFGERRERFWRRAPPGRPPGCAAHRMLDQGYFPPPLHARV